MELFGAKLQYEAAMKYYKGMPKQGYSKNRSKAFKLLKEASEAGLTEAIIKLSEMYFDGEGCKNDYQEAIKWLERAANKGSIEAQYRIGCYYLNNNRNYGCEYLEKAASQGHVQAMFTVSEYYVNHDVNIDKAIEWLSKPIFNNNPDAVNLLGKAYETQEFKEYELEHPWIICVDDIDFDEECDYDTHYKKLLNSFESSQKVNKIYGKALKLYEEGISFGNWRYVIEVIKMYLHGAGCTVNQEKAFDYAYLLANQEEGESHGDCSEFYRQKAIRMLAKMYKLGIGCEKSIDKYKEIIQKYEIDEEWLKSFAL